MRSWAAAVVDPAASKPTAVVVVGPPVDQVEPTAVVVVDPSVDQDTFEALALWWWWRTAFV